MTDHILRVSDTDGALPKQVSNGFARYEQFNTFADGGVCHLDTCVDRNLGRTVVFKALHPASAENNQEVGRFVREARVTAQLSHPGTVPIYELSRDMRGRPYFTMKKVDGITLREVLERLVGLDPVILAGYPVDRLIEICLQVGDCLAFAHAHGVVHRDVKPANIIIGEFGEVMVLDWGLAKVWDDSPEDVPESRGEQKLSLELTRNGQIHGTPLYMSPEQARGALDMDLRTDIYSLGAVLYELLTLRNLVWGQDAREVRDRILNEIPDSPRKKAPGRRIPREVDAVCMKALAKDPNDRYEDMRAFMQDLRDARAGRYVSAYLDTPFGWVLKWFRTHQTCLLALGIVLWTLLVVWLVHMYHVP